MDEVNYHLKNYGDRGECYQPRPIRPAEEDNTLHPTDLSPYL